MTINLRVPTITELKPRITVFGVGGAGGNAVSNMIDAKLEGVEFVIANTDAQALAQSKAERRIQMGTGVTEGLGAGSRPEIGCAAAEESISEIRDNLQGSHMVFITAGMGGGTGTGAAPVIAREARDMQILTVGVVTKPFHFEGARRMRIAEAGIAELQKYADTLIVIPNQNLFRIANEKTTFAAAFAMADEVLHSGVRGITDLMVMPGLINLDFADVRTVMNEMGKAMMGTGEAEGETRAIDAAEAAINNPLLDEVSMKGAKGVLINITGGMDLTLYEVDEAANRIRAEVDPDANIIVGSTFNESMEGRMRVSVVATGIEGEQAAIAAAAERAVSGAGRPVQGWRAPGPPRAAERGEHGGGFAAAPLPDAPKADLQPRPAEMPFERPEVAAGHGGRPAGGPARPHIGERPELGADADLSFARSVKKMSIGFLDRMAGERPAKGPGEAPQAEPRRAPAQPQRPQAAAPRPQAPRPPMAPPTPEERAKGEPGEAQLDIPAFLRRQAN
ncbi:MAG: cell division protein FtsZ [Alphaproteobacteria bacterium]|nr:cell division protein FtsZ [Alphaproteobacteria bacterium]